MSPDKLSAGEVCSIALHTMIVHAHSIGVDSKLIAAAKVMNNETVTPREYLQYIAYPFVMN